MGTRNSKRQDVGDDIISKKSLEAVKELTRFLKEHSREEGLFRRTGRREVRRHILSSLKKGEKGAIENADDAALECAAALRLFLSRLKEPVMPQHVQALLLADNPGVSAHVVALDALGLIRQDVSGRHGELLADLLDLLRHLTLTGPPSERSELHGSTLPIALLPVFFTLTPADLIKWKQVATRFSELITEAPEHLRPNQGRSCNVESAASTENVNNSNQDEIDRSARFEEFSSFYPIIRLTNDYNVRHVGEMARVLAAPLCRAPAGRLHPVISNAGR